MKWAQRIARVLLGIIYLVYGLNYFLHYWPAVLPPGKGGQFESALINSGYFFEYMKGMQVVGAILLLFNRWVPLVILILFPISVNIFLFHIFLAPKGLLTAIIVITANSWLICSNYDHYKNLLIKT